MKMLILLLLLAQNLLAQDCPPTTSPASAIKDLSTFLDQKKCSIHNKRIFDQQGQIQDEVYLQRLSSRCASSWEVTTQKGKILVPAALNVLRINDTEIIFHLNGTIYQGRINSEAFTGKKDCQQSQEVPVLEAFKEEALFHLSIAKELNPSAKTDFNQVIDEVKQKIENPNFDLKRFKGLQEKWIAKLETKILNKVERVQKYQAMIKKALDPLTESKKPLSETTLIVPLSTAWFESDPELKAFYQKTWIGSGFDLRIQAGSSGEGVTFYPNKSDQENESFLQMKSLMEKTTNFLQKEAQNKNLQETPEGKWLVKGGLAAYERMIFISPNTWIRDPRQYPWAEGIPVNQSLGGLESDYLLSVIIHEMNVNSPVFLSQDTHGLEEETKALRLCLQKNGVSSLANDPITLQRIFGYNSQLSVIYLKMFLD